MAGKKGSGRSDTWGPVGPLVPAPPRDRLRPDDRLAPQDVLAPPTRPKLEPPAPPRMPRRGRQVPPAGEPAAPAARSVSDETPRNGITLAGIAAGTTTPDVAGPAPSPGPAAPPPGPDAPPPADESPAPPPAPDSPEDSSGPRDTGPEDPGPHSPDPDSPDPDSPDALGGGVGSGTVAEIREEIDAVRRALDEVENAPLVRPSRTRWIPFAVACLVGIALVAGASVASFQLFATPAGSAAPTSTAAPAASSPGVASPGVASPGPTSGDAPADPLAVVPAAGPGVTAPGSYARVSVTGDDVIDVYERAVTAAATERLTLDVRPRLRLGGSAAAVEPLVTDLQVMVDGQVVPAEPEDGTDAGAEVWTVPVAVAEGAKVELRYRVTGSVVRSTPSSAGRALAVVTPLTGWSSQAAGEPVIVQIAAANALGISCIGATPQQQLCGVESPENWTAAVPEGAGAATVVVQAVLPAP